MPDIMDLRAIGLPQPINMSKDAPKWMDGHKYFNYM